MHLRDCRMRTLICTPPVGSQARQSVTSIDGLTGVVSTQSKFALSVVASCFGSCHPLVVVAAVEIFTVSQLVMACKRTYSNILTVSLVVALSPVVHRRSHDESIACAHCSSIRSVLVDLRAPAQTEHTRCTFCIGSKTSLLEHRRVLVSSWTAQAPDRTLCNW